MKDTNKLERVLKGIVDVKNGNRVRQITNAVVKRYAQNPEELKDYFFHPNELVQGVATGAYAMITGDLDPALSKEYGGLGATLDYTKLGLSTSRKQLHFAKLLGTALCKSNNSGFSLWFAETYGNSLGGSKNSEDALAYVKTHENSLTESENTGRALLRTENRGNSLYDSDNSGWALLFSKNYDNALNKSTNSGNALGESENYDNSLSQSTNYRGALSGARINGKPFRGMP